MEENKKPNVIIIGHVDNGKTTLTTAIEHALRNQAVVVVVGGGGNLEEVDESIITQTVPTIPIIPFHRHDIEDYTPLNYHQQEKPFGGFKRKKKKGYQR